MGPWAITDPDPVAQAYGGVLGVGAPEAPQTTAGAPLVLQGSWVKRWASDALQCAPMCHTGLRWPLESACHRPSPFWVQWGVGGRWCVNDEPLSHLRSVGVRHTDVRISATAPTTDDSSRRSYIGVSRTTFSTLASSTVSLDKCSSAAA
jgi:hypothetical protein